MTDILQTYLPFAASLIIAVLMYLAFQDVKIISFGKSAESRLGDFAESDRRRMTDKMGAALMDRLGLNLDSWGHHLRWAQIGGYYKDATVSAILGKAALYGLVAFTGMLIFNGFSILTLGMAIVAAWLPYIQVHDKAEKVRESVRRALPEAAAFVAGEMAAGVSADAALSRSAVLTGPLAKIIGNAADEARTSGRLLLSQASVQGMFREFAESLRMVELVSFASQVDMVSSRGAEGPKLMNDVAKMLARGYRTEINRAAAGLGMKILIPMTIFFLVPMLASMLVPLFVSILITFL